MVLLGVFVLSLPAALQRNTNERRRHRGGRRARPGGSADSAAGGVHSPIWLAIAMLAVAGVAAALVSDWFVHALQPAIDALGISDAFAGLVIVAIAGNAVENVVGIQLALRNKADFAMRVIIHSPLQIALVLAPLLVLLSLFTATTLTLVFAPILIACGDRTHRGLDRLRRRIELAGRLDLVGLYAIIATLSGGSAHRAAARRVSAPGGRISAVRTRCHRRECRPGRGSRSRS